MSEEIKTTENAAECAGLFDPAPATPYEKAIADYLTANASDALREKIAEAHKAHKGIKECYAYITAQARKEAKGNNSVMIADEVVYGWAVHYFEDEWQAEIERDRKHKEEAKAIAENAARKAKERKAKAKAKSPNAPKTPLEAAIDKATGFKPDEADEAKRKAEAEAKEAERRRKEEERKAREAERAAKQQAKAEAAKRKADLEAAQLTFTF